MRKIVILLCLVSLAGCQSYRTWRVISEAEVAIEAHKRLINNEAKLVKLDQWLKSTDRDTAVKLNNIFRDTLQADQNFLNRREEDLPEDLRSVQHELRAARKCWYDMLEALDKKINTRKEVREDLSGLSKITGPDSPIVKGIESGVTRIGESIAENEMKALAQQAIDHVAAAESAFKKFNH